MTHPVKQAVSLFKQGHYQEAKRYYQYAADTYGSKLFEANLALCDKYLHKKPISVYKNSDATALAQQLADTQARLEHYYSRCQELQYQLMDAK